MRLATVNFNARAYKLMHGHLPRGVAIWTFYFKDDPLTPWRGVETPIEYLEAKRLAATEARRRYVSAVRVDALGPPTPTTS